MFFFGYPNGLFDTNACTSTKKGRVPSIVTVIADPIADRTKTGGRTLALPDIATVSLSKLKDKIEIVNPDLVFKRFWVMNLRRLRCHWTQREPKIT